MLLKAIDEGDFRRMGSQKEEQSRFFLVCGTNADLKKDADSGLFRKDLLGRIKLWSFTIPPLREHCEDIPVVLRSYRDAYNKYLKIQDSSIPPVRFTGVPFNTYNDFAMSGTARWPGNYRDLSQSFERMAAFAVTNANGSAAMVSDINLDIVNNEIIRLKTEWSGARQRHDIMMNEAQRALYKRLNLAEKKKFSLFLKVCRESRSKADAGKKLFAEPGSKANLNYSDRVAKQLARWGIDWDTIRR
jgi:transcriptional regulatory protein RtcR